MCVCVLLVFSLLFIFPSLETYDLVKFFSFRVIFSVTLLTDLLSKFLHFHKYSSLLIDEEFLGIGFGCCKPFFSEYIDVNLLFYSF